MVHLCLQLCLNSITAVVGICVLLQARQVCLVFWTSSVCPPQRGFIGSLCSCFPAKGLRHKSLWHGGAIVK